MTTKQDYQYYKNGAYKIVNNQYHIYGIPLHGGKPVLEGIRHTEQDAKELINTFT